jgi:hypothetical protein
MLFAGVASGAGWDEYDIELTRVGVKAEKDGTEPNAVQYHKQLLLPIAPIELTRVGVKAEKDGTEPNAVQYHKQLLLPIALKVRRYRLYRLYRLGDLPVHVPATKTWVRYGKVRSFEGGE